VLLQKEGDAVDDPDDLVDEAGDIGEPVRQLIDGAEDAGVDEVGADRLVGKKRVGCHLFSLRGRPPRCGAAPAY